jgi:hypothetical protein
MIALAHEAIYAAQTVEVIHAEKFRAIGGKEDEELRREDTEKNWDGGVTTHG